MTLWKTVTGLALALAMSGCVATSPAVLDGAYDVPGASRSARAPGVLSEIDIVRAVQSSL